MRRILLQPEDASELTVLNKFVIFSRLFFNFPQLWAKSVDKIIVTTCDHPKVQLLANLLVENKDLHKDCGNFST